MSPRAACRLEQLGFEQVFDYVPGKADWLAAGLPTEGPQAAVPRAGDMADAKVPTCALDERIGDVRERLQEDAELCVVLDCGRIVVGLMTRGDLAAPPDTRVAEVMLEGPTTFRPNLAAEELAAYLRKKNVPMTLITNSDGELVGLFDAAHADRRGDPSE